MNFVTKMVALLALFLLLLSAGSPLFAASSDIAELVIEDATGTEVPTGLDIGVELELNTETAKNHDAELQRSQSINEIESRATFNIKQTFNQDNILLAKFRLTADLSSNVQSNNDRVSDQLKSLYYQRGQIDDSWRWRVGRQPVSNDMGWMLDEDLDGIRVSRRRFGKTINASVTRQDWLRLSGHEVVDAVYNYYGALSLKAGKKSTWTPYFLYRYEVPHRNTNNADSAWIGLQGKGKTSGNVKYWFNSAMYFGTQNRSSGIRASTGYAVDSGATAIFDLPLEPSITFGFAHASGHSPNDDSQRRSLFRQSGLHSNEHKFNGLDDFRYLGETVDPELTNIQIVTIGAGIRSAKRWSLDAVYHLYKQVELEDRLRGSDLDSDPSGTSADLGQALDIIAAFNASKSFELKAVGGIFEPGAAFSDTTSQSRLFRLELTYQF